MIDINNINQILKYKIYKSKHTNSDNVLEYTYEPISDNFEIDNENIIYDSFSNYINNLNNIKESLNESNEPKMIHLDEYDHILIERKNYLYNYSDVNYYKFTTELKDSKNIIYSKDDCIKIQNIFYNNE